LKSMNLWLWIGVALLAGALLTCAVTGVAELREGGLGALPRLLLALGLLSVLAGLERRLMII